MDANSKQYAWKNEKKLVISKMVWIYVIIIYIMLRISWIDKVINEEILENKLLRKNIIIKRNERTNEQD